jgi:hypothetical protein
MSEARTHRLSHHLCVAPEPMILAGQIADGTPCAPLDWNASRCKNQHTTIDVLVFCLLNA